MTDITREQLGLVLTNFRTAVRPDGGRGTDGNQPGWIAYPEDMARDLLFLLGRDEPGEVVDAHVCCEHADGTPGPFADPEITAMAALAPVLPLVSKLGCDARSRVMEWATRRANDGLAPF